MSTDATTLHLRHLSLGVGDTNASEAFYRDVLGLPTRRVDGDIHVRWPDFLLVLHESPPADRAKFHFGFQVTRAEDVDHWAKRLRDANMEIMSGPFESEDGLRQIYFVDPDNYEIEIYYDPR